MLVNEINILREILNSEVEYGSLCNEGILTLSQNLDKLIAEYYKLSNQTKS